MNCSHCNHAIPTDARFCSSCGAPATPYTARATNFAAGRSSRLVRPRAGRVLAGVCAGFANAYGWDVTIVRILTAVITLCTGVGLVAYVVAWVSMPEEPLVYVAPVNSQPQG